MNKTVTVIRLWRMAYSEVWRRQQKLFQRIVAIKQANRGLPAHRRAPTPNYLIFCEHPHVITMGRNGDTKNVLLSPEQQADLGIEYFAVERGGDATYHGPGQLVVYPILDLENFFTDIRRYMRYLEEAVIRTLAYYGLAAGRIDTLTGVWIDSERPAYAKKICALGVKMSRWATFHGLALNVNVDLSYFNYIVPCGLDRYAVTSMHKELGGKQDIDKVALRLLNRLCEQFEMTIIEE